jgi:lipopolysaccharide transport system ATP-binding protein
MADSIIAVEGVSKRYVISHQASKGDGLRHALERALRKPWASARKALASREGRHEEFWALRDLSFEIKQGETVGVVGRNGAGKSTLLKVLSRITEPTSGRIRLRGRTASLLEVGTGFHPELTGRENIFLNGAILGMSRQEIIRKFDQIVDFSELEKFLDTPVKRYSTGMYVRLAFAVAAHLEPEILIVDEVLAVGDAEFQRKCLGKMGNVAKEGRTVLFVSHQMRAVMQLCERAILLDAGRVREDGPAVPVVNAYLASGSGTTASWVKREPCESGAAVNITEGRILSIDGTAVDVVNFDAEFKVEISYEVLSSFRRFAIISRFIDLQETVLFTGWESDGRAPTDQARKPGRYVSTCHVPARFLKPGRYWISLGATDGRVILGFHERVLAFLVSEVGCDLNTGRMGVIAPPLRWEFETQTQMRDASSRTLPRHAGTREGGPERRAVLVRKSIDQPDSTGR